MHPALSVIAFSTLSGAGYGLLFLLGLQTLIAPHDVLPPLLLGTVLITAGLLASTAHLGQPRRAWRAFSQWRSSWLSREGVAAVATYVPLALLGVLDVLDGPRPAQQLCGVLLTLGAAGTVFCTARIYSSLPTVPAWRLPQVVPGYFGFGLLCGAALLGAFGASAALGIAVLALALALGGLKLWYWRALDTLPALPIASALGLPPDARARSFETPHTEANYISREMVFVLARRHRQRLRRLALLHFAALPALLMLPTLFGSVAASWFAVAALAALLGAFVERWLFFAEARHIVATYYQR